MDDFLGRKTKDQINMIKAIVMLKNKSAKTFSANEISRLCKIPSRNFAGAFMALANPCGSFPPLVLRAGREKVITTDGKRRYVQLWKHNPQFAWSALIEALKSF